MVYECGFNGGKIRHLGYGLLRRLQELVLPPRCIACGNPADKCSTRRDTRRIQVIDLCQRCQAELPMNLSACRHCALSLSGTTGVICGRCLQHPPPYQASWCAFEYTYPVTYLVRRLKYGGALATSRVLGNLLAEFLRTQHCGSWPECFIPVPLHSLRYQSRGYNQVIELGRHVEQALGIPMRSDLVMRTRYTPEQAGLSRRARRKNLYRAFVTTDVVLPKHVAVLDDVITTGSTMNELTKTLKKSGVQHVELWGLARASFRMNKH